MENPEYSPGSGGEGNCSEEGSVAETLARYTAEHAAAIRSIQSSQGIQVKGQGEGVLLEQALVLAAKELGLIITDCSLESRRHDAEGQEHDVWFDLNASPQLAWKANKVMQYGLIPGKHFPSTPLDYLERVMLTNEVFGMPWEVHGVWLDAFNRARIVTVQQYLKGQPAKEDEIEIFFADLGFVYCEGEDGEPLWIHNTGRFVAGDAYADNFVVLDGGEVIPIDVPLSRLR